jgi:hypothetical protein
MAITIDLISGEVTKWEPLRAWRKKVLAENFRKVILENPDSEPDEYKVQAHERLAFELSQEPEVHVLNGRVGIKSKLREILGDKKIRYRELKVPAKGKEKRPFIVPSHGSVHY